MKEEARRGRRTGGALVILLFLLALPAWPLAPAAGQGTVREHVEARLEVALTSPTGGTLDGNFSFFVYELNGTVARADEIRASILSPEGCNTRSFIERNARFMLIGHFLGLFPNDTLTGLGCVLDNSSLEDAPGTDGSHPPVVVRARGVLRIGPASFGLPPGAGLDRLAPLLLADGAELHRELALSAPAGHLVEVSLTAFPGSVFGETGGPTMVLWMDNREGPETQEGSFGITLRATAPVPRRGESIRVRGAVDIPDLRTVFVIGSVELERADPTGYWQPPSGIRNLTAVSGTTLSEMVRSGLLSEAAVYEYGVLPVQRDLQDRLAQMLAVGLRFTPSWSLEGNLTCTINASSEGRALFGHSTNLVQGAIRAGARLCLSIPVAIGWPAELFFQVPADMALEGLSPAPSYSLRPRYQWSSPTGRGTINASLAPAGAPGPAGDDVSVSVLADFGRPELELGELLSRGSTDVPVRVDVGIAVGNVGVPASFAGFLPENLTLDHVTADLLRLLLAEGVLTDREMNAFLQEVRPRLDAPMRGALGRGVQPAVCFVPETLRGYNLSRMDGSRPVEIHAWASGERTKGLELFKAVRASPGLGRISQDFSLTGIPGWNTTYRIRFSADTRLVGLDRQGAKVVRGSEGGRDYFDVTFGREGGWANITAYLEPTPGLLLASLGPVACPFSLLLIVGVVLVLRRARRRRAARRALTPEAAEPPGDPEPDNEPPA